MGCAVVAALAVLRAGISAVSAVALRVRRGGLGGWAEAAAGYADGPVPLGVGGGRMGVRASVGCAVVAALAVLRAGISAVSAVALRVRRG
ncbi:hypothetical protein ACIQ8G_01170, partial [Streptomyces sp. NPDC094154]|uniref:hypothetical protein n=1 Tax=Streptomyces sp. NPDC094154 TaxID=3366059 RepID=UPI0037F88094